MKNRIIAPVIASLALLVATILGASPASAHTYTAYNESDWAQATHGYTCPTSGTCYVQQITVHDGECDGNAVRVDWVETGIAGTQHLKDGNGCTAGNGVDNWHDVGSRSTVTQFRVCEESTPVVCSNWKYPQEHAPV